MGPGSFILCRMTINAWPMTYDLLLVKCDERCFIADRAGGDCENHDYEDCGACREIDEHDGSGWWWSIQAVEDKLVREALHLSLSLPNISVRWYSHGDKLRSNYLPCLFLFVASTVLSCLTFVCRHAQCFHSINTGFSFVFRIWNRTGIGDFFGAHIYLSIYIYIYTYIYTYISAVPLALTELEPSALS